MDEGIPPSLYTVEKIERFQDETAADFERAIKLCGYGKFHYGFVLLCGMIFLCVGCQNGVNAYILPSAECDLQMTSEEKGLLNVAFLTGGVMSAGMWGLLADVYGRKNILVGTLMADSVITIIASLSQSFNVLLIFRIISGFTIGCPGSLIYSYLGEFHAEKWRAKSICYIGFFWTLSWLILPGLAWMVIPLTFTIEIHGLSYNSWRLFLAIIGVPTFIVGLVTTRYPESPKYLVSQEKFEEALTILRKIYAYNTGRAEDEYPIKTLLPDDHVGRKSPKISTISSGVFSKLLRNLWQQIHRIGSPPLLKYSILCSTMYFANVFGYYGLGLWLPELFSRFETYYKLHPNTSVSVCELSHFDSTKPIAEAITRFKNLNATVNSTLTRYASTHSTSKKIICNVNINDRVFINAIIINAVCLLGNLVSGYLSNRVGRRTMPVTTMLLSSIFAFAIYFVRSTSQNLIVACLYSLSITTGNVVMNSVVVDVFPTEVGAVAVCLVTLFGRLGAIASNLLFGMLLDISCKVPIFLVGIVVLLGGLLGFLLPLAKVKSSG